MRRRPSRPQPTPGAAPAVVTARLHEDLSYLRLDGAEVRDAEADVAGRAWQSTRLQAFCFTDRGVYRPGERVAFGAIVRDARWHVPRRSPSSCPCAGPTARSCERSRER